MKGKREKTNIGRMCKKKNKQKKNNAGKIRI